MISLKESLKSFVDDILFLQKHGIYFDGRRYQVTDSPQPGWVRHQVSFSFSSDWKFLVICQGLNAANSEVFCVWCQCTKEHIHDMTREWRIMRTLEEAAKYLDLAKKKRMTHEESKKLKSLEVFFSSFHSFFWYLTFPPLHSAKDTKEPPSFPLNLSTSFLIPSTFS